MILAERHIKKTAAAWCGRTVDFKRGNIRIADMKPRSAWAYCWTGVGTDVLRPAIAHEIWWVRRENDWAVDPVDTDVAGDMNRSGVRIIGCLKARSVVGCVVCLASPFPDVRHCG